MKIVLFSLKDPLSEKTVFRYIYCYRSLYLFKLMHCSVTFVLIEIGVCNKLLMKNGQKINEKYSFRKRKSNTKRILHNYLYISMLSWCLFSLRETGRSS